MRRASPPLLTLCGLLVALAAGRPLGAQRPVVLEAGFTGAHFRDDDASVFGPSLRLALAGTRGRLFASGEAGTLATFGAAGAYALLEGGVRSTPRAGWSTELAGELSTVAGSNNSGGAGTALLGARLYRAAEHGGASLRATGHASGRANATLGGGGVEAGAWWSMPRVQVNATLTQEWTRAELYLLRFREGFAGTTPVRYTEGALAVHTESDRASLDVVASLRRDPDAASLYERATSVSGAVWLGRSTALVLTASRQHPDWVRGGDAVDAVSLTLRFYQPTPAVARLARVPLVAQVVDTGDAHFLRVRAAGATRIEVMGDFTEWEAKPLLRRGDVFEHALPLASGSHRLLIRLDGGAWRTAVNTPAVDDDFGGRVGLLVVP